MVKINFLQKLPCFQIGSEREWQKVGILLLGFCSGLRVGDNFGGDKSVAVEK